MNKYFLSLAILLLLNFCNNSEVGDVIKLPEPQREGGMPLYEALNNRKSSRDFDDSIKVPIELLSQALWCCYGIREGVFRTVPAAKAWYPLLPYIFMEDGVFLYNPESHELTKLFEGDHRDITGTQTSVVTKAGVNIVFIGDLEADGRIDTNKNMRKLAVYYGIGHVTMALSLFASANKMKGVVKGNIDSVRLLEFLGLNQEQYMFALAFSLGY